MLPSISNTCQACSKEIAGVPQRCSICKGCFYCDAACQKADWSAHKKECSPLPADLSPAQIELHPELEEEVEGAKRRVKACYKSWKDAGVSVNLFQNPDGGKPADERFRELLTPQAKVFANHRLPPAYDLPSYPGRPSSDKHPHSFQHALTMTARLFLLYELARMPPSDRAQLARFLDPSSPAPRPKPPRGHREPVRLFAPKVFANPGGLSAGEYAELVSQFMAFSMMATLPHLPPRKLEGDFWMDLMGVAAQARSSKELLKWGAVEGPVRLGQPGQ